MGSYNMSCALTGCSISPGDKAVVVLAKSSTNWAYEMRGKEPDNSFKLEPGTYFHDDDTTLAAVVPAVRGVYDDYGHLDWNYKDNPALIDFNTEYSINTLIEPYGHGCEDDNEQVTATKARWPQGLFAIWIRAEAWDAVVEYANSTKWHYSWFPNASLLSHLGFQKQEEATGFERYTQLWTHPEWPENYAMASDRRFGKFAVKKDGKWVEEYVCVYRDMVEKAKEYGLVLKALDWDGTSLSTLALRGLVTDAASCSIGRLFTPEYLDTLIKTCEEQGDTETASLFRDEKGKPKYSGTRWAFICGSRNGEEEFCDLWAQKLVDRDPDVERMCAELYVVKIFFYLAGRLFIPTHGGPQCGEPYASKILGEITTTIADERLEEWEEEWMD